MPHLRLEISANIEEKIDSKALFIPCHHILANTVNAPLLQCQSRATRHACSCVGTGEGSSGFIYLEIALIEGRTSDQLQSAKKQLLEELKRYFAHSIAKLNVEVAVLIVEFPLSLYEKMTSKA